MRRKETIEEMICSNKLGIVISEEEEEELTGVGKKHSSIIWQLICGDKKKDIKDK